MYNQFIKILITSLAFIIFNSQSSLCYDKDDQYSSILTVAVSEFRADGVSPDLQWLGKSFADALILRLSQSRTVRIVERIYLEQILEELKLQHSDLFDEKTAAQLGRLLGAKLFVMGSVSILNNNIIVRARIVSVERGEILGTADANGAKENIFLIQETIANRISSKIDVDIAITAPSELEITGLTLNMYADLDRIRQLAKGIPQYGLDPARARKKADYQLGLSICDKLLASSLKLSLAHYYKSLFSLQNGEFEIADKEIQIACKLNPNDLDILLLRGNVLMTQNDTAGAVRSFEEVTDKFTENAWGWYALGRALAAAGNKLEAISAYIKAAERTPIIPELETNLRTLIGSSESLKLLEQLKDKKPEIYFAARIYRAFWNVEMKSIDNIIENTIKYFPRLYLSYYMKGLIARSKNNFEKALINFQTCVSLRPQFPDGHRAIGLLYLDMRRCSEGEQHISIYMATASFVDDYDYLEKEVKRCKETE